MSGATGSRGPQFIGNVGLTAGAGALPPAPHAASHEDTGSDEINVNALSGELADDQPPKDHATDHQNAGSDEINVAALSGELADPQPPKTHAATHQDGGGDEISVAALNGELADDQPAKVHALGGAKHNPDTKANLESKVSDATLLLSNQAAEFLNFPQKVSPAFNDNVVIEEGGGIKKYTNLGQIPIRLHLLGGAEHTADTLANLVAKISDANVLYSSKAGEIAATTLKATPVAADTFLIEDSAASNAKKRVPFSALGDGGAPNVGFYAKRTSGNQTLNSASETKVAFPAEDEDPGSDFNTTTYVFTAPTAGRYTFTASAQITLAIAGRVELRLYHGSTLVSEGGSRTNQAESLRCCVAVVRHMAASETMEVRAFQTSGFAATIQNSGLHFAGAQIRAD